MPYIVEVRAPFGKVWNLQDRWAIVNRRAVATLDDAQWRVAECISTVNVAQDGEGNPLAFSPAERADADAAISDAGGELTLADGCVVKVELTTLPELAVAARVPLPDFSMRTLDGVPADTARIIDAYNAAQEN